MTLRSSLTALSSKEGIADRLSQSLETALKLSNGIVYAENADNGERTIFSSKFACPVSGFTIEEIEPRLFSFNNPFGACPHCDGIGAKLYMDPDLIVPNPNLSLSQGAIAPWNTGRSSFTARQSIRCASFWTFRRQQNGRTFRKKPGKSSCTVQATSACRCIIRDL